MGYTITVSPRGIAARMTKVIEAVDVATKTNDGNVRMRCSNNLKQLALGLLNYHDALGQFPPSGQWPSNMESQNINASSLMGPNWVISILPG